MSYRLRIILRLLLIFLLGGGGVYVITSTYFWLVGVWMLLFAIISIWELIRFLERENRDLGNFLMSIKQQDFSGSYSHSGRSNSRLYEAFNVITAEFAHLRQEKESNYHFLQVIVEHSTVPMICFREENGEVTLMNQAAKTLFNRPFIKSIETLKKIDKGLFKQVSELESGEKTLLKVLIDRELTHLSVMAKELKMEGELYKLVSFQDIKAEMDEQEIESWQKLIRVLTHEIKNSAIPISTLIEVINQMITQDDGSLKDLSQLDSDDLDDLKVGIATVEKRSKGLVKFVNAYSELAKLPTPKIQVTDTKVLIIDVLSLLRQDLQQAGIILNENIGSHQIKIDPELVEQMLINLIKNAKEALEGCDKKEISISTHSKENQVILSIKDTGPGMDKEVLHNIFIPFYTTKKHGSGIGLSLSKQIMRAHKGDLQVKSEVGAGTEFTLVF